MSALSGFPSRILRLAPPRLRRYRHYSHVLKPNKFVQVSEEVREALASNTPVVALETAIYTHGFPFPDNVELASQVETAIRGSGAVPATIGIIDGIARVGFSESELERLASSAGQSTTVKVSRRDLPFVTGMRRATSYNGGTTISGTMILAHMAGIKVFATGGLGGVHRGYPSPMDVSADLTELGRTNVAVISAGSKAFLDLENTFEVLETQGVFVGTFGRPGTRVMVPAFYSRESSVVSPNVLETAKDAASIIHASHTMGLTSGQLFCNPIPAGFEIPEREIKKVTSRAVEKARDNGVFGKDQTPYILNEIKIATEGTSLLANIALVINNAQMGARVAQELAKLEGTPPSSSFIPPVTPPPPTPRVNDKTDVLVIGSIAVDISCDVTTAKPSLHTSNPSNNTETLGGVGKNVALAAQLAGARVRLVSAVGSDLSGVWAVEQMRQTGMDTTGVQVLQGQSTARYVAVNDASGELFTACADMHVIENMDHAWIKQQMEKSKASVFCVDGNLSSSTLQEVLKTAKELDKPLIFEPTSTAKSTRILSPTLSTFPRASISISTPNAHELAAMFARARETGLFENGEWWKIIDAINVDSVFLNKISNLSNTARTDLTSTGLVQSAIHLSPYIPRQLIKLGANGVLLVRLLPAGGTVAADSKAVVSEGFGGVGGIEVRYFPAEVVRADDVVSVNGVGDTFLGVVLAGLAGGGKTGEIGEEVVERAQRAARLTLGCRESVSPGIGEAMGN